MFRLLAAYQENPFLPIGYRSAHGNVYFAIVEPVGQTHSFTRLSDALEALEALALIENKVGYFGSAMQVVHAQKGALGNTVLKN